MPPRKDRTTADESSTHGGSQGDVRDMFAQLMAEMRAVKDRLARVEEREAPAGVPLTGEDNQGAAPESSRRPAPMKAIEEKTLSNFRKENPHVLKWGAKTEDA